MGSCNDTSKNRVHENLQHIVEITNTDNQIKWKSTNKQKFMLIFLKMLSNLTKFIHSNVSLFSCILYFLPSNHQLFNCYMLEKVYKVSILFLHIICFYIVFTVGRNILHCELLGLLACSASPLFHLTLSCCLGACLF